MGDGQGETPLEKYKRFREDSCAWDEEMMQWGLTQEERKLLHSYLDQSNGICEAQERMMELLLNPQIAGWSLGQVDKVRKSSHNQNKTFLRTQKKKT